MMRFLFLLLLLLPHTAHAADLDYKYFAALPVQHEGRIKPIDTFARAMLENFSGHESMDDLSADAWLAETLFDPAQALHRPIFRIFRPDSLNLPAKESKYYSFADLAPALQAKANIIGKLSEAEEKEWSEDQRELMRLSESALLYTQLLRSFSFVLPLNVTLPPDLAKEWKIADDDVFTLQDYRKYEPRLKKKIQAIIARKGDDPAQYNESEKAAAQLAMDLQILESAGQNNILLRILRGINGEEWFSPWALTEQGQGSPQSAAYLKHWESMTRAYQYNDATGWSSATKAARAANPSAKLNIEVLYNKIHPLLLAGMAYLAAFIAVVFYSLRGGNGVRLCALAALGGGAFLHLAAIAVRVYILDRAPVGTLYESIIFVSLVCVIVALAIEKIRKDGQGVLIGALAGPILLFVAGSFADGDTMKMLVAVLNTNFWLSTHVLCITMGYGWCVIASLLAHIWLVRTALGKTGGNLVTSAKIVALIALLFTVIGTILGGIWADQSWGRFWGWDPKENGALLIVLWLIWVIHGQLGGQLNRTAFMASIAALSVVVALAWFGVNLLSVGLHSYGFITGVAAGLGAFCTAEILLIGLLWHRTANRGAV